MHRKQLLGEIGEDLACDFLKRKDYTILKRNFKCRQGEIDIIGKDKKRNEIVFFEVKTRTNMQYGEASEAVNKMKRQHIYKAIEYYIYTHPFEKIPIRIDVIEVYFIDNKFKINHIKQAF